MRQPKQQTRQPATSREEQPATSREEQPATSRAEQHAQRSRDSLRAAVAKAISPLLRRQSSIDRATEAVFKAAGHSDVKVRKLVINLQRYLACSEIRHAHDAPHKTSSTKAFLRYLLVDFDIARIEVRTAVDAADEFHATQSGQPKGKGNAPSTQ